MNMRTPSTVGYANARLRARRQRIFREDDYNALMGAASVDDLIRRLRQSVYAPFVDAAALRASGADVVGAATSQYFASELAFVTSMYTRSNRRCIEVIAANQDLVDFKTVIRGKLAGAASARVTEAFIGSGWTIKQTDLQLLAAQETIGDVIDVALTLKMPYARILRQHAGQLRESMQLDKTITEDDALIAFERSLDKAYYRWANRRLDFGRDKSRIVRWYIKSKIDISNILIAQRALHASEDDQELVNSYFIEGGQDVSRALFDNLLAAESIEQTATLLDRTQYAKPMQEGLVAYALDGSLNAFERRLTDFLFFTMQRKGYQDLLGMGLPVAYVLALNAEAINVRIIAHAKSYHVSDDLISEELIHV